MSALYPLLLEPKEVPLIWGGNALVRRLGKRGDPDAAIGESWECWDENRVVNGAFAGKTIAQLRAELGRELLGRLDPSRIFPLLTKFIDARQSLSVQVHPDDVYAQRVEGQPNGKTECWYVLEAQPDAKLVLGWNRDTSREEYLARVRDGSLGELLRQVPVRAGDAFYLPAGTLHAIGAGIVLFEVQQASDLTYRIFDWNRMGADGKPRALHVEKAADVLDYRRSRAEALRRLPYTRKGLQHTLLVADPRFVVERVTLDTQMQPLDLDGMPMTILALDAPVEVRANGVTLRLQPYASALLAAGLGEVMLACAGSGDILLAGVPHDPEACLRTLSKAGIAPMVIAEFFDQFWM